jgi:2-polyprenyl-3-methyl-5-hydroxy-6-metoxy-1,4-benzoquinol methylase
MSLVTTDKKKIDPTGLRTLEVISKARRFNRWMYETIQPYLKDEILEIGSGIGNISAMVIAGGHTVSLSDYNAEYIAILEQRFGKNPLVNSIRQIDLLHPEFEREYAAMREQFSSLILLNVIEHLPDDAKAIKNCRFFLKKGGRLIVLAPSYPWLFCDFDRQLGHYRRYTLKEMTALLQAENFSIIGKQYFNFVGIAGWLISGKLLRRKMVGQSEMSVFDSIVPVAKAIDSLVGKKAGLSVIVSGAKN